jgi:hypothetical protein
VAETYLYQLLDAYPDPSAQDSEKHYGLFDIDSRPKVSAQMLRRLLTLLHDDAPNAHTFALRPVDVTIQGLPTTARTLVIEKASGETLIAIWDDTPVWDATNEVDLEGPKTELALKTAAAHGSASVIDLAEGTSEDLGWRRPTHLNLGKSPLFLRLLVH